jgi:diphthamide synthase (EF-2-diphthine--ammonia ligase)
VEWGKDSALALLALRDEQRIEPQALITTVTAAYGRVNMHGVRRELVRVLACALRSRLVEVAMPASCPDDVYEARTAQAR